MSDEIRAFLSEDPDARWEAIARHLAGESDPAESAAVEAWLTAHPEDAALAAVVKARADRAAAMAAVTVDTEAALARVRARIGNGPTLTVERGGAPRRAPSVPTAAPRRRWRGVGFAAAAGLAAIVGISQWRASRPAAAPTEYRTAVGQRDSLRLPDGTTVVLAPGSRLTVASGYQTGAREVTLEGAAFFEVQHDDAHPFTVHTASADIRDIGTAFSVKTAASGVSVAVTHGIVSMGAKSAAATELRAGDRATMARGTVFVQRGVVTAEDVSWTRGQLAYRDAPLSEVQADLQRWYGLDLRIADSTLAARTLTATFRGDSAAQVVHLIALALGADAVQKGDTIFLQPQGSGSPTP
ncbi:MAG: FecR domain-containing protein [Gemmatimonadaceae bacterium]|nr:FecR domain-containing protein [Gemmatimonadaceae bacterium]